MSLRIPGLAILALSPLAACASPSADYPSLAIRDAERLNGGAATAAAESDTRGLATAPALDLTQRLAQLQAEANSAHQGFVAIAPRVTRMVEAARNAGLGSDRWASAQVAISELDTQRSLTAIPLADLDLLYAARAVELDQRSQIIATQGAVQALVDEEDRILRKLKGGLAQ